MTPRELINRCLRLFRPTSEQGKAVLDLVALCEKLLAGARDRPSDESALRREIDEGPLVSCLALADLLEEQGEDAAVCAALRDLARKGKWPGGGAGSFRWSAERPEFGGGSSWTLSEEAVTTLRRKSRDVGGSDGGKFPTASAALLAAARVTAAASAPPPPAVTPHPEGCHPPGWVWTADALKSVPGDWCDCAETCRCDRARCCRCRRIKRGR